jgi:hypothetical protein
VVYKSNAQIGPYKTETAPKKSEYAMQFKEYQPEIVPTEPVKRVETVSVYMAMQQHKITHYSIYSLVFLYR